MIDQSRLPVLTATLQQPLFAVLKALGMLVGVFEWHQLVMSHFGGRISRKQASELTVQAHFDSLPPADRDKWVVAFTQFKTAWRVAWPFVDRYECLEITDSLKQVMVNEDSAMVYCICDAENEGICPLALTQWLVARHNELVQIVASSQSYPQRKVSSRLLGQHDLVKYDAEDLKRFLCSRCVTYGEGGKLHFDLKQLEHRLRTEMSRPEITLELRAFQWLGESFSQAAAELRAVMKQKELAADVVDRIRPELTNPTVANDCLRKVSMAATFIVKAGAGLSTESSSEMLLSEYMRTVLCETQASDGTGILPSMTARSEVRLCHIDAFIRLLKQLIERTNPMDKVDPRFKEDMPAAIKEKLMQSEAWEAITGLKQLVETLGDFGEQQMGESCGIGPDTLLIDTLGAAFDAYGNDAEELAVVKAQLPKELQMKHWSALYEMLQK